MTADCRGADELRAQEPLAIEDGGNVWRITGSRPIEGRETIAYSGPISMSVSDMSSNLFELIRLLESGQIHFSIRRSSPFGVMLHATMIGKRIEIGVDEDDNVDVCVFRGSEDLEFGMDAVLKAPQEDE
jgi:hypothetical protein